MSSHSNKPSEYLRSLEPSKDLSAEELAELERMAAGEQPVSLGHKNSDQAAKAQQLMHKEGLQEKEVTDLRALISDMTISEKIKTAMFGNSTCRALLISDPNPLVHMTVLANPQLQEGEVETFSKNTNISEMVLREISNNRAWMKAYMLKYNLVMNAKTPTDLALKWLRFLHKNDLRKVARSKSIPQQIAVNARKQLSAMERRK